jgi:peptidoglycan/xylan/chitin deacetylase (PgdA/CDA1 family)
MFPTDASPDHALMDWDELARLAEEGFTIGSHGRSHALLAHESAPDVLRELLGSRLELERRLGRSVHHVAYPAGSFDATTVRIAAAAGYQYGYACCRHGDPRLPQLAIPRRVLWENSAMGSRSDFSPALLSCQIHGVVGFGVRCAGHAPRTRAADDAPAPEPTQVRS